MSTRTYPTCCQSAFCGKTDCSGCPNEPVLREFKEWVARTGAKVEDPIWCPTCYTTPSEDRWCRYCGDRLPAGEHAACSRHATETDPRHASDPAWKGSSQ